MTTSGKEKSLLQIGNYRLTGKRLGKGNFARVEEAIHVPLNTRVAVKVMNTTNIKEEYVIKNLYREAKIMSKLSHPCIVALFQTMQYGNVYYIVTEFVGGGDLCTYIKNQTEGKINEKYARIFARQLVSAISHMHSHGIVHRDLKMENIMLNVLQTQIKIVDFGLSNIFTEDAPLKTHCGSPEYAAPELFIEGRYYGPEVDLWSLGVILYGMVVGQLPFVTAREEHVSAQERRKNLLEQINKGLSSVHRKALIKFSPEFKGSLMPRLLVANSQKRLTITELIYHPWITEKGKKLIRTNPLSNINDKLKVPILKTLSQVLNMDVPSLNRVIKTDPQGNIAGYFSIYMYKHVLQSIEENSICRSLPVPDSPSKVVQAYMNMSLEPKVKSSSAIQGKISSFPSRKEMLKSAPNNNERTPLTPKRSRIPSANIDLHIKNTFTKPSDEDYAQKKKDKTSSGNFKTDQYSSAVLDRIRKQIPPKRPTSKWLPAPQSASIYKNIKVTESLLPTRLVKTANSTPSDRRKSLRNCSASERSDSYPTNHFRSYREPSYAAETFSSQNRKSMLPVATSRPRPAKEGSAKTIITAERPNIRIKMVNLKSSKDRGENHRAPEFLASNKQHVKQNVKVRKSAVKRRDQIRPNTVGPPKTTNSSSQNDANLMNNRPPSAPPRKSTFIKTKETTDNFQSFMKDLEESAYAKASPSKILSLLKSSLDRCEKTKDSLLRPDFDCQGHTRKDNFEELQQLINQPIARSIASFVTSNLPYSLLNSMLKTNKKVSSHADNSI